MEKPAKGLTSISRLFRYKFKNSLLLYEALTHPSSLVEKQKSWFNSYQRLEFIGDKVINLVTAEKLFRKFPNVDEGRLTRFNSLLTSNANLAKIAKLYNLGDYVTFSEGARKEGLETNNYVLACVFEAVIGAIFLDSEGDFTIIRQVLEKIFLNDVYIEAMASEQELRKSDPKSYFQEIAQKKLQATPEYRVVSQERLRHSATFAVEAVILGIRLGLGEGGSIRAAEKQAARNALEKTNGLSENIPPRLRKMCKILPEIQLGKEKSSVVRRRKG